MTSKRLTVWILAALVLGLAAGTAAHARLSAADAKAFADALGIITDVFLRLIKMIIAPLVLATLVAGIAHMGSDSAALGRIGGRALLWFVAASVVSLTLGLLMVNLLRPGIGLHLPLPPAGAAADGVAHADFSAKTFITHLVPRSIVEAMAGNEILQIVVFAVFAGVGLGAIGERGAPIVRAMDALMALMLQITGYVMRLAPLAVFAAVAATVAGQGLGVLRGYAAFMGGFYLSLTLLWALLLAAGAAVVGPARIPALVRAIREPTLLAFSTASSEAAFPQFLAGMERFGVPRRIAAFVLPLGYSFNLDGSMMYCSFATLFIAQAYGIPLSAWQQMTMLLLLMVTSKGIASVPRASLVVISGTLGFFHLPEGGLLLILGVDHFLDMGRTATNVIGNAVATVVVTHWEGALGSEPDIAAMAAVEAP